MGSEMCIRDSSRTASQLGEDEDYGYMIERGWKKPVTILDLYFFMSETPFERRPPLMITERMKKIVLNKNAGRRFSLRLSEMQHKRLHTCDECVSVGEMLSKVDSRERDIHAN